MLAIDGRREASRVRSAFVVSIATLGLMSCSGGGESFAAAPGTPAPTPVPTPTPAPVPTVTISALPTSIVSGSTAQLNWSSTDATGCTASAGWTGAKSASGTMMVGPLTSTTNFVLDCSGAGGSKQASASVVVTPASSGAMLSGAVDSSFIKVSATPRIYVYAGNVTPRDYRGDSSDPIASIPVLQQDNACGFQYALTTLPAGTYTVALVPHAELDRSNQADTLEFDGVATLTVAATGAIQNFSPTSVLRVGPTRSYKTVAAAAAAASDGSVIEVDAGEYDDDIIVWRTNNVVVRGEGGRAHIVGTHRIDFVSGDDLHNGMGLWVVRGSGIRIENIEFSGAQVTDLNGAGIRNQGRDLTICNGYFHDNENGFLGGAYGTLTVEYSIFAYNGAGDIGHTHNIYVDDGHSAGDRLIFRYNYSHHAHIGHQLKTRAGENYVLYNRLMDEADGDSSYAIDVPNGGLTYVIGNVIQQGPNTDNSTIISYGAEGLASGETHEFYVGNNTIVNDRGSGTFFDTASGTSVFRAINNLTVGSGTLYSGKQPAASGALSLPASALRDAAAFDYRLKAGVAAIDAGVAPGSTAKFDLTPLYQYMHPAQRQVRPTSGQIDVGAYEYAP